MFAEVEYKYPYNITYIVLAVAAILFFILSFRKKEKIILLLGLNHKIRLKTLRTVLLSVSLGLMVFSLLGPLSFTGYTQAEKKGLDIYVLIDTSKSMLVSDVLPDRITAAKKIIENLLNNLSGDRIGFIPFASDAYIQMPLTDDYQLARMFLDVMDTDMINGGGTNIAAAIKLANDSFKRTSSADRVIIIISDGEEHDDASQGLIDSLVSDKSDKTQTMKIYTIGIGTNKGGLVPVYDSTGSMVIDYMKDENGNAATSRLHAETLIKLANDGGGVYYQASSQGFDTASLINELSYLKRDVSTVENIKRYKQLYQYFLGAGIIVFLVAWFLPDSMKGKART